MTETRPGHRIEPPGCGIASEANAVLGTGQGSPAGADRADSGRGGFPAQGACPFTERQERFRFLCEDYEFLERPGGVGVMGEKGVHAVLKRFYQPDVNAQEIRVGRFVADAVTGDGSILEIQTGPFAPLRKKLAVFLERYEVTIVHPAYGSRWVRSVDPQTGELLSRRRCGRPESAWKLFYALPAIREYLDRPNLHFLVPVLEVREWRVKGDRRRSRRDRVPSELLAEFRFAGPQDFLSLLPEELSEPFTSADLAAAAAIDRSDAQMYLYVVHQLGLLDRVGKRGNAYLYAHAQEEK